MVEGVLRGRPEAESAFFERSKVVPRLVAALNRRLGNPLDAGELEDVAQSALAVIWEKLEHYAGQAPLEAWMHRVCQFELMNAFRKRTRRPLAVSELTHLPASEPAEEASPEADADDELRRVADLLRHLSAREAEVVRLRHFEHVDTLEDVGRRLGISKSAVKTHYYRALDKLRAMLVARKEP